jgi:hypothetical protein
MRFFTLFTAVLPAMVMAIPGPGPLPNAAPDALTGRAPLARASADLGLEALITARQLDLGNLGGLLANLSQSFQAIESLLSPTSLGNIQEVVNDLAALLKSPTPEQAKSLLGTASDLLSSNEISGLLKSLPSLLSSVQGLITPALITNATDILGNAHQLLTPDFVSQTKGLIADIAPVSSP